MSLQIRKLTLGAAIATLSLAAFSSAPAMALTQKECGEKYQAAKTANTLNGMNYNAFRKAQCAADAPAANPTAPAAAAPAAPAPAAAAPANPLRPQPAAAAPKPAPAAPAAAPAAAAGPAVFPKAIDPKYSTLSAGRGREKTCLDQYNANKATGGNGGMKWIEKGGGYYSECNKKLKG